MTSHDPAASSRSEAMIASSDDAVYSCTPDGRIVSWNPGAEALLGYPAAEVIGQGIGMITPSGGEPAAALIRERIAGGQRLAAVDTELRHRDGRIIEVSLATSPILDRDTKLVGIAAIARDISARRTLEREREVLMAEIQRRNAELEQYAYAASHDLSEPLRVIAGMVQLLERRYGGALDAEAHDYIARTVAATTRMRTLIDDLLEHSRIGSDVAGFVPVDCRRSVELACAGLSAQIEEAAAQVDLLGLPTVSGDPALLERLFQNLISNAIKFRGADPPHVVVAAALEAGGWHFTVADNGIGIPAQHAERVFRIFKRLHSRDRYPGTGMGLAICQKIVEHHRGRIWCEPGAAGGSVFHFILPSEAR